MAGKKLEREIRQLQTSIKKRDKEIKKLDREIGILGKNVIRVRKGFTPLPFKKKKR